MTRTKRSLKNTQLIQSATTSLCNRHIAAQKMKVAINQQGWRTDAESSRSVLCFIGNLNGHVSQFKVREFDVLIKNQ